MNVRLLALALLAPLTAASTFAAAKHPPGEHPHTTLTEAQVRDMIAREGYTRIHDLGFEDGLWEADATSADGRRVDVRVDPDSGRVYGEGGGSKLSPDDVVAKLTAAGYSHIHDVKYEDGIWEARADASDGRKVKLRVDPGDGRVLAVHHD